MDVRVGTRLSLLLVFAGHAGAQTLYLPCLKDSLQPRRVTSPEFVSEKYRAYVEAEAAVDKDGNCSNRSRLFVGGGGESRVAFEQKATLEQHGNGLRIVDWSRDGRNLVLDSYRWEYDSDIAFREVLLYRADQARLDHLNLNDMFSHRFHKRCAIWPEEVRGFTPVGEVVAKLRDVRDAYYRIEESRCIASDSLWAIDAQRGNVRSLPADYRVKRYSRAGR